MGYQVNTKETRHPVFRHWSCHSHRHCQTIVANFKRSNNHVNFITFSASVNHLTIGTLIS